MNWPRLQDAKGTRGAATPLRTVIISPRHRISMPLRNPANIHRLTTLVLVAIVTLCARQSATPPTPASSQNPTGFSLANAQSHVAKIATEPHPNATPANARVRQFLVDELTKLDLNPQVHTGQSFGYTLRNITATLPGSAHSGRAILLAAHYDSVPGGPGASDDAAAVAALLETCRALKAGPPLRHDVRLLITDGEEFGLLGARAYFEDPATADVRKTVALALNFDLNFNFMLAGSASTAAREPPSSNGAAGIARR